MPPGETLGNGGQFVPMPGFDPGMMGPSEEDLRRQQEEMERQQEEMRRQQILQNAVMQREAVVGAPLNFNRPQPLTFDVNAVENGVESVGGTLNLPIDKSQQFRIGGIYMPGYSEQSVPIPQTYRVEAGYNTPSFGVNVNYRPRRTMGMGMGGGLGGMMNFNQRF
jgi:hypothetical protein